MSEPNKAERVALKFKESGVTGLVLLENKKPFKKDLAFRIQGTRGDLINLMANAMARHPEYKAIVKDAFKAYEAGPIKRNNERAVLGGNARRSSRTDSGDNNTRRTVSLKGSKEA